MSPEDRGTEDRGVEDAAAAGAPATGPAADLVLDALGRRCPVPVIMLARSITEVPVGGVVAVLADDPAARLDVPAWCRMRGHDHLGEGIVPGGAALGAPAPGGGVMAQLVRRRS